MSEDCCQQKEQDLIHLKAQQTKVLWLVMAINLGMFIVECSAGIRAYSLSLMGDSLDMLGDTLVYASSLYVLRKTPREQARAAFLKGIVMVVFAIAILARAVYQASLGTFPVVKVMGAIGVLALLANLTCLFLLMRHRKDNLNMTAVWLCSRNDIIANVAVLVAAVAVAQTQSIIPDLLVGALITVIFAKSATLVLSQAWRAMRQA